MEPSSKKTKVWIIVILFIVLLGALVLSRQFTVAPVENEQSEFDRLYGISPDTPPPTEEERLEFDRLYGVPEDTPPPTEAEIEEFNRLYGI